MAPAPKRAKLGLLVLTVRTEKARKKICTLFSAIVIANKDLVERTGVVYFSEFEA